MGGICGGRGRNGGMDWRCRKPKAVETMKCVSQDGEDGDERSVQKGKRELGATAGLVNLR